MKLIPAVLLMLWHTLMAQDTRTYNPAIQSIQDTSIGQISGIGDVQPVPAQDSPVLTYWRARKSAAINDLVSAFNQIGYHASQLRAAMPQSDAEAFDALMLDMMGALVSLPEIRLKTKPTAGAIRPLESRPNRVPQLTREVDGLVRFFHRLRKNATDRASQKLFGGAEKSARKMAAALSYASPTMSIASANALIQAISPAIMRESLADS
jgi:hypothetical protein